MVTINENGFTITVETALDPTEQYLELIDDMLDLLQSEDEQKRKERYYCIDLIKAMLPKDKKQLQQLCNTACNT